MPPFTHKSEKKEWMSIAAQEHILLETLVPSGEGNKATSKGGHSAKVMTHVKVYQVSRKEILRRRVQLFASSL